MAGETNLKTLLGGMKPELAADIYVFASLPSGSAPPAGLDPVMIFREREGITLILRESDAAAAGLAASFRCRMITLTIHSSLEAVGFLAVVAARLARAGMGVNPVSAYHHDHLFVPADQADEAMEILRELANENAALPFL